MTRRLPPVTQRYFERCLADRARDIEVVIVDITGKLKLEKRWYDFESTLEVGALCAFRWTATVHDGLVRFSGHDEYRAGHGRMDWRLFHLVPVVHADDPDVTRSARGRAAIEQIFLPAALARPEVQWSETGEGWARAAWVINGEEVAIELKIDGRGAVHGVRMQRWSDAEGEPWRMVSFGADARGEVEAEGLVVPEEVTAGWFYGSQRWDEGRFFGGRVTGLRRL